MQENEKEFLNEKIIQEYGEDILNRIIDGYHSNRLTTIRVNTLKSNVDEIKDILTNNMIQFETVEWNTNALILKNANETDVKNLDIYEDGKIYMQSLSSMIPPIIVDPKEKEGILDMAAAPGGKTTQMAAISNNQAMITACEKNKIRADRLKYNLQKQGANRVTVMIEDSRKLDNLFSFDKILLDAPCSGSGTLHISTEDSEKFFSKELVERSIRTQKELLKKASMIIKKGGEITYSTCSIFKEENEEIIKELLTNKEFEIVPIEITKFKDVPLLPVTIEGTLCVCPTEKYEGFFVAKIKKC